MPAAEDRLQLRSAVVDRGTSIVQALRRHGAERGWWPADGEWQRTYARFMPDLRPYCVQLYEDPAPAGEKCLVLLDRDPPAAPDPDVLPFEGLGWLTLKRFPDDPRLPTLRRVLAENDHVCVMRYEPLLRCSLTALDHQGQPMFGKVLPDQRGLEMHEQCVDLWLASQRGELDVMVAEPRRWDPARMTLWQGVVSGIPVIGRLFSMAGPRVARRLGTACASLPLTDLQPSNRFDAEVQMRRSSQRIDELKPLLPEIGTMLDPLPQRLAAIHDRHVERQLRPIHGGPHPHLWLMHKERPALIDFDRFSMGDPEQDVATFITAMEGQNPDRVPVADINAAFVDGYESVHGRLEPDLLAAYRAHKRLARLVVSVRSLPDQQELGVRDRVEGILDVLHGY